MPNDLKMGQKIIGRVTYIRDDGRLNISIRPVKEKAMSLDAENIYEFMKKNNGEMKLTDKSDPVVIKSTLGISKSAFKRAIGNLLKDRKIILKEDKIILSDM
ncbi:Conserved virulence factor B [Chlamydia trachomatis]|nr:Conserved virulence factor B [Chlamydia trachomatis]